MHKVSNHAEIWEKNKTTWVDKFSSVLSQLQNGRAEE